MGGRRFPAAVALCAALLAGCGDGDEGASEVGGLTVEAGQGYEVVALPEEVAESFRSLSGLETADGTVAAVEAVGIHDEAGQPAAILLVTRYADLDVTSPDFTQLRRSQAASEGATLTDDVVAGTPVLTSTDPVFVSWTRGTDTLVVLSGTGAVDLEQAKAMAADTIAANR